jgi:quercetin dioxygenase-like cupin family protein
LSELTGVTPLLDLVQYQSDAVISRTLLKKPAGTVTAFAFDAGEGLSEHTAAFDALLLVLEGDAEVSIAGKPHRVGAGEFLILPASQPHALRAATRLKMLLIMIKS